MVKSDMKKCSTTWKMAVNIAIIIKEQLKYNKVKFHTPMNEVKCHIFMLKM